LKDPIPRQEPICDGKPGGGGGEEDMVIMLRYSRERGKRNEM
jgi:hypothetical protein